MYAEGKGVPRDHVLAYMWLNLIVSQLPPLGKDQQNAIVDALNLVMSEMSPSQVAEALQLEREWMTERRHGALQKSFAITFR